jgi:hypothetical protein
LYLLSTLALRAEAAGPIQLLTRLSENPQAQLLVFIDNLVLLNIAKVGEGKF